MAKLALVPGLLTVRLKCRHADGFSFRAVRYPRAVRSHVAIAAIEFGKIAGELVTQGEFVGRRVPAGIGRAAALHFQREGSRPSESFCAVYGDSFQKLDGLQRIRDRFEVGQDVDVTSRATISVRAAAREIRESSRMVAREVLTPDAVKR